MRPRNSSLALSLLARLLRRLRRDERGVTVIEFAMVATPFFMFIFGTIGIGLHFFITNSIEHAVEAAARKIRTGQAQTAGTTMGDFKSEVCAEAASFIECNGKLQIHIQHDNEWSGITPASCKDGTSLATAGGASGDSVSDFSGEESEAVLITVCYQWDLPASMPFISLGDPDLGGAAIIQAATTFRTEPYK